MGVAWMPRPARDDGRYRPEPAEAVYWVYWVMTLSTALRALADVLAPLSSAPAWRLVIALGGLGQLPGAAVCPQDVVANPHAQMKRWRRGVALPQTAKGPAPHRPLPPLPASWLSSTGVPA